MQSSCPSLISPAGFTTIRFQWKFSPTRENFPASQANVEVCVMIEIHSHTMAVNKLNLTLQVLVDLFTSLAWFLGQSHVGYNIGMSYTVSKQFKPMLIGRASTYIFAKLQKTHLYIAVSG